MRKATQVSVRCVDCGKPFHRTYQDELGYGRCTGCGGALAKRPRQALAADRKARRELDELAQGGRA